MTPAEDRIRHALLVLEAVAHNPTKALVLTRIILMGGCEDDVFDLLGMYDDLGLEERVREWSA